MFGGGIEVRPKNRALIRKEKLGQSVVDLQSSTKSSLKRRSNGHQPKEQPHSNGRIIPLVLQPADDGDRRRSGSRNALDELGAMPLDGTMFVQSSIRI